MGQGGQLALVNGTPYRWKRVNQHSYQMASWNFPDTIAPFSKAQVYVEWDEGIFKCHSDDCAEANYVMDGAAGGRSFQIQARWRHLQVVMDNVNVAGRSKGYTIDLGWLHDGTLVFALAGRVDEHGNDEFFSTGCDMSNWMKSARGVIGNMNLKQLCMAGAHDAGMSVCQGQTAFGFPELVLTQTKDIGNQLALGTRFFDIRPIIGGGQYYTGHYSNVKDISFQGGRGQSINDIVSQLNAFTRQSTGELIVLRMSHTFNTDVRNTSYRSFTKEEWDRLLRKLLDIEHRCTAIDLINTPLNTLLGQGSSAVAIVIKSDEKAQFGTGQGFYAEASSYPIDDDYANKFGVDEMKRDQFGKLLNPAHHNNKLFMLNWICTQQDGDIAAVIAKKTTQVLSFFSAAIPSVSVLDRAGEANQSIGEIYATATVAMYPNVILADRIETGNTAVIAAAINLRNANANTSNVVKPSQRSGTGDRLGPGERLLPGDQRISSSGVYQLIYQTDGNLCIYNLGSGQPVCVWTSNTAGVAAPGQAIMQSDENFVLYSSAGQAYSATGTWVPEQARSHEAQLIMQDDGNLVLYKRNGQPVWASQSNQMTRVGSDISKPSQRSGPGDRLGPGERLIPGDQRISSSGVYQLIYQTDGNLCIYNLGSGQPVCVWATHTAGVAAPGQAIMQSDENFVLYSSSGHAYSATGTWVPEQVRSHEAQLIMQDDGNLVLYKRFGQPVWASQSNQMSRV